MQLDPKQIIETVLALTDDNAQRSLLLRTSMGEPALILPLAEHLKLVCDQAVRESVTRAEKVANLLEWYAAVHVDEPRVKATSLRASGNLVYFKGDCNYQHAIDLFDEAADIYRSLDDQYHAARSQIGKVICLGFLGETEQATTLGETLKQQFESWGAWETVFQLLINLQSIYSRQGDVQRSLVMLDQAREICAAHGYEHYIAFIESNRALDLRDLGDLQEAERVAEHAETLFHQQNQIVSEYRTRHARGTILYLQGRYNETLHLFQQVRDYYLGENLLDDAAWVDLAVSNCLLQLGRFQDVLSLCHEVRERFTMLALPLESGEVILNEGRAFAGLKQFDAALQSLSEANALFRKNNAPLWAAQADLERATILIDQGDHQTAFELSTACRDEFSAQEMGLRIAQANLVRGQAALGLGNLSLASDIVTILLSAEDALWLRYQAYALQAQVAQQQDDSHTAMTALSAALDAVEQLRGRMMLEHRVDFLDDKTRLYEEMVALQLADGDVAGALETVERSKSRALIDLFAGQLDMSVQPRSAEDRALTEQLTQLQHDRDLIYRRWITTREGEAAAALDELHTLEQSITKAWHTLLVRNADYAREAALTTVRSEPIQPYLAADQLILEFFAVKDELMVFCIAHNSVSVFPLTGAWRKVSKLARMLNLNFKAASTGKHHEQLTRHAQRLLAQLYDALIRPIAAHIAPYRLLTIIPHGAALHYLPFQALFDGQQYLCELFELNLLPSASLLHYARQPQPTQPPLVLGYSNDNSLPYALEEAAQIAAITQGRAFKEADATRDNFYKFAPDASIIHLSTHADFNQNNPLFSGLSLANGQLSTLDIFNLRLQAQLVTLSACQTGRSVVTGGDELLGLMRAFLYAGASSLLLSLWRVNDQSTMQWMQHFYTQVQTVSKSAALQQTQKQFIHHEPAYTHPYFWASFFLVGDGGMI